MEARAAFAFAVKNHIFLKDTNDFNNTFALNSLFYNLAYLCLLMRLLSHVAMDI